MPTRNVKTERKVAWVDGEPLYVEHYQEKLKEKISGIIIDQYNTLAEFMRGVDVRKYDLIVMEPLIDSPQEVRPRLSTESDYYGYALEQLMKIRASGPNRDTPIVLFSIVRAGKLEERCKADYQTGFLQLGVEALRKPELLPHEFVESVKKYLQ